MRLTNWLNVSALVLCAGFSLAAHAQPALRDVIYVNGVGNEFEDALASLRELDTALATTPTRSPGDRRSFRVRLQYNQIGWPTLLNSFPLVGSAALDFMEMITLKVAEECFVDDLRELVVRHDSIRSIDRAAAERVREWSNDVLPGSLSAGAGSSRRCGENVLVNSGAVTAADVAPLQSVAYSLSVNVLDVGGAIVVAHSQGNLLANLAYASLAAELGDDVSRLMRVVNVANTSSVSVNGLDATHDADFWLSALARVEPIWHWLLDLVGLEPVFLRRTPHCGRNMLEACPFQLATPTLVTEDTEGSDHGFVDTYLSDHPAAVIDARGVQFTVGAERMVDRLVDLVYAAAASLDVANAILVSSASCESPVVGSSMTCTITGTGLPADTVFTATNCSPGAMTALSGGSALQRQFSCAPQTIGVAVEVSYAVPGYVGSLPPVPTLVALAPPVSPPSGATHPLNDTGAVTCVGLDSYSPFALPCTSAEAIATNDRQDGMVGRDVTSSLESDGALGFSFEEVPTGAGGYFARTECIRDRVTGLIWEGKPISGSRAANLTYRGTLTVPSTDSAETYVAYVNSLALCGFADWRLPTIWELQGVVHYGASADQVAIDLNWFVNTAAASYRTSSGLSGGFRRGVDFTSGRSTSLSPFDYYRVRLIRGPAPPPPARFVISPDGNEALDQATGLIWRRCMEGRVMSPSGCASTGTTLLTVRHGEALTQARQAGGSWRLPNIKELSSIPIDSIVFPDFQDTSCWSSTPSRFGGDSVWAATPGAFFTQPRSLLNCVRLVR